MKKIKVKTPAKVNLTLEILNKRDDGYHNLQSIMQAISLYDYLTVEVSPADTVKINLSGNSKNIPYDSSNLVYKAAVKFLEKANIKGAEININIEKHIPVAAGLAGGSTNAAGTFYALNKLYKDVLSDEELDELCASLGSDLNFCLHGGCMLCTSRGEITEKLPFVQQDITLIKPKKIGISTKEAYESFAAMSDKSNPDNTTKLIKLLKKGKFNQKLLYNSFEKAILPNYEELENIKKTIKNSLMSGSGSTFFVLEKKITADIDRKEYDIFDNLKTVNTGVKEVNV